MQSCLRFISLIQQSDECNEMDVFANCNRDVDDRAERGLIACLPSAEC